MSGICLGQKMKQDVLYTPKIIAPQNNLDKKCNKFPNHFFSFNRVFAKITLSYDDDSSSSTKGNSSSSSSSAVGSSRSRSAPLDLLLYDSLCWECESGSGKGNFDDFNYFP